MRKLNKQTKYLLLGLLITLAIIFGLLLYATRDKTEEKFVEYSEKIEEPEEDYDYGNWVVIDTTAPDEELAVFLNFIKEHKDELIEEGLPEEYVDNPTYDAWSGEHFNKTLLNGDKVVFFSVYIKNGEVTSYRVK